MPESLSGTVVFMLILRKYQVAPFLKYTSGWLLLFLSRSIFIIKAFTFGLIDQFSIPVKLL